MKVSDLVTENRAASPVVGAVLMVAIAVVLAAVVGSMMLGLGTGTPEAPPSTSFDIAFEPHSGGYSNADDVIRITVTGGDTIDDPTEIKVGPNRVDESSNLTYAPTGGFTVPIEAGDEIAVEENGTDAIHAGDEVFVIYRPDEPQIRAIVGSAEVPT